MGYKRIHVSWIKKDSTVKRNYGSDTRFQGFMFLVPPQAAHSFILKHEIHKAYLSIFLFLILSLSLSQICVSADENCHSFILRNRSLLAVSA